MCLCAYVVKFHRKIHPYNLTNQYSPQFLYYLYYLYYLYFLCAYVVKKTYGTSTAFNIEVIISTDVTFSASAS
jgi:hypothetical protein